jgi:hypothetical protein
MEEGSPSGRPCQGGRPQVRINDCGLRSFQRSCSHASRIIPKKLVKGNEEQVFDEMQVLKELIQSGHTP